MSDETKQKNVGSNNANIYNSNNSLHFTININGNDFEIDIINILKAVSNNFENEDKKINYLLANKVLVNKTQNEERYQTEKIITSLLKLGIPLMAAYEIAEDTICRIKDFIDNYKYTHKEEKPILTTKDLRTMVSLSIQHMDMEKYSYSEIESWNNKYIRRYGHNNKRIKVYFPDCDRTELISYDFIRNDFLPDIVDTITKGKMHYTDIPARSINDVSKEILGFINNCDLYEINYDVLKHIVLEIATQPPHPWFINNETRQKIIQYDIECLKNNLKKIEPAINTKEKSSQPAKIEVLHHASSLILEKYNYFLGCYDLSSFYSLARLIEELYDDKKWDLTVEKSDISSIISDLSFSNISVSSFVECINKIKHFLSEHRINHFEFDKYLLEFGGYALRIVELARIEEIKAFLNTSWNELQKEQIINCLKLLLYSIYPVKNWNLLTKENYFWINYYKTSSIALEQIKNQFFVIYNDGSIADWSFLNNLMTARAVNLCNVILVISEENEIATSSYHSINGYLIEHNLALSYVVFWLDKKLLEKIFISENKMKCFNDILEEQLTNGNM